MIWYLTCRKAGHVTNQVDCYRSFEMACLHRQPIRLILHQPMGVRERHVIISAMAKLINNVYHEVICNAHLDIYNPIYRHISAKQLEIWEAWLQGSQVQINLNRWPALASYGVISFSQMTSESFLAFPGIPRPCCGSKIRKNDSWLECKKLSVAQSKW